MANLITSIKLIDEILIGKKYPNANERSELLLMQMSVKDTAQIYAPQIEHVLEEVLE